MSDQKSCCLDRHMTGTIDGDDEIILFILFSNQNLHKIKLYNVVSRMIILET